MRHLIHRFLVWLPATILPLAGLLIAAAQVWREVKAAIDSALVWTRASMNSPMFWLGLITFFVTYGGLIYVLRSPARRADASQKLASKVSVSSLADSSREYLTKEMQALSAELERALKRAPVWVGDDHIMTSPRQQRLEAVRLTLQTYEVEMPTDLQTARIPLFLRLVGTALETGNLVAAQHTARSFT